MNLIVKASNIDLEYNAKQVLDIPELEIYSCDKIGIVGKNGVGKTTLLKILLEQIKLEGAKVKSYGKISYIPQLEQLETLDIEKNKNAIMGKLKVHNLQGNNISGGEETKLRIAQALSETCSAIFADEPTCNLDEESIKYITNSLKYFAGAIVVISHDRYFLDEIINKIWEIKDGKIIEYWGNYTDYINQKKIEKQNYLKNYEQYIFEKERLSKSIESKIKQAQKVNRSKNSTESGGRLAHQKSSGSKEKALYRSVKTIEKRLEDLEEIEKPISEKKIHFRINPLLELHNPVPIMADNLNKSFEDKVILENAKFKIPLGSKVAIIGANGAGKTTLLKMMLNKENDIKISPKAQIGYFAQNGYKFEKEKNVLEFLKEESDYNVSEIRSIIAQMGLNQNVIPRTMETLSGGEVVKILLCKMLLGRYNILIMDEPNNFLDIDSITALEELMKQYKGTIIFVSHDKMLVKNVADLVYKIENYKIVE